MSRRLLVAVVSLSLGASLAACSGDEGEATTTTAASMLTTTTTRAGGTTGTETGGDTTTTTQVGSDSVLSLPDYEIVRRDPGEAGDTIVAVIDSQGALTDIDLQNILADIVDRFPPAYEIHVVDTPEAAALVLEDAPDDAALAVLAEHYLVRLEEGFRIVFTGPFSTITSTVLGS